MLKAADLRDGMCIKLGQELYKIVAAEFKAGTAKLPSAVHLRLRNLRTGTQTEQRLHPDEKVEDIMVETVVMEFSYAEGETLYFMHPETFEQVGVPKRLLGPFVRFLDSGTRLKIEFYGSEPVDVLVPKTVDVRVASTGPALHGDVDAAPKTAILENGMEVQVPQFIKPGDKIRIEVATGRYLERLH
ncbi:MAG: elongation factor P [candidate division WOR-3 bacterium]